MCSCFVAREPRLVMVPQRQSVVLAHKEPALQILDVLLPKNFNYRQDMRVPDFSSMARPRLCWTRSTELGNVIRGEDAEQILAGTSSSERGELGGWNVTAANVSIPDLYGTLDSLDANLLYTRFNIQKILACRPQLLPPSYRPCMVESVAEKTVQYLNRCLQHENTLKPRNKITIKERKVFKQTTQETEAMLRKATEVAMSLSANVSVGFGATTVGAVIGSTKSVSAAALGDHLATLYAIANGEISIGDERRRWMEAEDFGLEGYLNETVVSMLQMWRDGSDDHDPSTTYRYWAKQVLNDSIYKKITHAEVVTLLHCRMSDRGDEKGTLIVYVIVDKTHRFDPGHFLEGTSMSQYQIDWLLTIEDFPRWLWVQEASQRLTLSDQQWEELERGVHKRKTLKDVLDLKPKVGEEDEFRPQLNTTFMRYQIDASKTTAEAEWSVQTNDPAWHWFGQAHVDNPINGNKENASTAIVGNAEKPSQWTRWVNPSAIDKHPEEYKGQPTKIGKTNTRKIVATPGQMLCMVNAASTQPRRHRIPQMCLTDAYCWGGTRIVASNVGDLSYKLAGVGRFAPPDGTQVQKGDHNIEIMARWQASRFRNIPQEYVDGTICNRANPLTNFIVWD
jgi:hypothetical protein